MSKAPNLDRKDAGLAGGRRTNEELPPPLRADEPHFDLRREGLHLDKDNNGRRDC